MLFLLSSKVSCTYTKDTISINIKLNFNLWNSTRSWSNTIKIETTNCLIILTHRTLTLENYNTYSRLIISSSSKYLSLRSRNCSVCRNKSSHNFPHSLNTERNRSYIKKKNCIFGTRSTNYCISLNRSTLSYSKIKIRLLNKRSTNFLFKSLLNNRNTARTTNKNNSLKLIKRILFFCKCNSFLSRTKNFINYWSSNIFKSCTSNSHCKMLRSTICNSNIRKIYFSLSCRRKFNLSFFCSFYNTLHSHRILSKINTSITLIFISNILSKCIIKICTTTPSITVRCKDFKNICILIKIKN